MCFADLVSLPASHNLGSIIRSPNFDVKFLEASGRRRGLISVFTIIFGMIIRVRSNVGTWKLKLASKTDRDELLLADLIDGIVCEYNLPQNAIHLSMTPTGEPLSPVTTSLRDLNLENGSLVYLLGTVTKSTVEVTS